MRRLLCMVLTGAVMIGCLCTGAGAVDESNVISYSFETTGTAITRATGNLDWTNRTHTTAGSHSKGVYAYDKEACPGGLKRTAWTGYNNNHK